MPLIVIFRRAAREPTHNKPLKVWRYVVGSKSFRPDQLFKVTQIKQLCYFSI